MKKIMTEIKRALSILLAVAMIVTLVPESMMIASAEELNTDQTVQEELSEEANVTEEEAASEEKTVSEENTASEEEETENTDPEDTEADEAEALETDEAEASEAQEDTEEIQGTEIENTDSSVYSDTDISLEGDTQGTTRKVNVMIGVAEEEDAEVSSFVDNDGTVEVTYNEGCIGEGGVIDESQSTIFKLKAKEHYKIIDVTAKIGENYFVSLGYNQDGLSEDTEYEFTWTDVDEEGDLVLQITLCPIIYSFDITFQSDAEEYSPYAEFELRDLNGEYMSNSNSCQYGTVYTFTIYPLHEDSGKILYVSTAENGEGTLTPDENGYYTVTITENTVIYVKARPLAAVNVSFAYDSSNVIVAEVNDDKYSTEGLYPENCFITSVEDGDAVVFGISTTENSLYSITSVEALDSAGDKVEMTSEVKTLTNEVGAEKEFTVYTIDMANRTKNVTVTIVSALDEAKANNVTLTVNGNPAGFTAQVVNSEAYTEEYGADSKFTTEDSSIIFNLKAADSYEISEVKAIYTDADGAEASEALSAAEETGYYTVDFTETGRTVQLQITVSGIAVEAENTITFNNRSDYMTYSVTEDEYVKKISGKTNVFTIAEGAKNVLFTVTAKGKYEPVVTVNGIEQIGVAGKSTTKSGVTSTVYSYNVAAGAFTENEIVEITDRPETKTLTVDYDETQVKVTAKLSGKEYLPTEDGSYKVNTDTSLVLVVKPLANCQITGATTQVGSAAAKKVSAKATGTEITVKVTDNAVLTITSKGLYTAGLTNELGEELTAVKNAYTVSYDGNYTAYAVQGVDTSVTLSDVTIMNGKKAASSTAAINVDGTAEIAIDQADAGKNLTVTLYTTADDQKVKVASYTLKVSSVLRNVTIKGVSKNTLTQTADTVKEYAITASPKTADLSRLQAEVVSGENLVAAELVDGKLIVTTGLVSAKTDKAATIQLYEQADDAEEKTLIGSAITVNLSLPAWAGGTAPTVKAKSSDDVSVTLTLTAPKTAVEPNKGSLYYKVTVTPKSGAGAPESSEAVTEYILKEGASQDAAIVVNNAGKGKGVKWKYDFTVTLVQTDGNESNTVADDNVLFSSKAKTLTAETKTPAYESKLTLKKGTTTIYPGRDEVLVATVQFSKNTTFTDFNVYNNSVHYNQDGTEVETFVLRVDGNKIYAKLNDELDSDITGSWRITVTAESSYGMVPATATLDLKIGSCIKELGSISMPSDRIYKADKKAATMKVTAMARWNGIWTYVAAKAKEVTYEITDVDGNALTEDNRLYGMVTVKNGTVTVNKNYVVSADEAENTFCVKASVVGGSEDNYVLSDEITITAETLELGEVCIAEYDSDSDEYTVISRGNDTLTREELEYANIIVLKKGVAEKDVYSSDECIDTSCLSYKSSNKALAVYEDGIIGNISKTAKNVKITVSANDGGKKSAILDKLTIGYSDADHLWLSGSYNIVNSNNFDSLRFDENKVAHFTGTTGSIMQLSFVLYDEENNLIGSSYSSLVNYKLAVKNAKVLRSGLGYTDIQMNTKQATVTLTYNGKSEVYTIINDGYADAAAPKVSGSGSILSTRYINQEMKYSLSGSYDYTNKYVVAEIDPSLKYNSKTGAYYSLRYACSSFITPVAIGEDGTFSLTFTQFKYIPAGSYKVQLTFGTMDGDGTFIPDAKPVTTTLKVTASKATGSYKPVSGVKLSKTSEEGVKLKGTGKNILSEGYYYIYNTNVNGQPNKFTTYFELSDGKLKLKSSLSEEEIASIKKEDLTGYVYYSAKYGSDAYPGYASGYAKITVTLTN